MKKHVWGKKLRKGNRKRSEKKEKKGKKGENGERMKKRGKNEKKGKKRPSDPIKLGEKKISLDRRWEKNDFDVIYIYIPLEICLMFKIKNIF